MGNEDKNREPGIPVFAFDKKNKVELSVYKLTTGFLVMNIDTGAQHPMTGKNDVSKMFEGIGGDMKNAIMGRLNELNEKDFVSVTIIMEQKANETVVEPQMQFMPDGPAEMSIYQIADMFNDFMRSPYVTGIPGVNPFGISAQGGFAVRPENLANYMASKRFVKIVNAPVFTEEGKKGSKGEHNSQNQVPGKEKPFFHDSGKNREPQQPNKGGGQSEQAQATEIK